MSVTLLDMTLNWWQELRKYGIEETALPWFRVARGAGLAGMVVSGVLGGLAARAAIIHLESTFGGSIVLLPVGIGLLAIANDAYRISCIAHVLSQTLKDSASTDPKIWYKDIKQHVDQTLLVKRVAYAKTGS